MSQGIAKQSGPDFSALEAVILQGDISKLTSEQRGQYVGKLCEVMGLNPLTKPFEFMNLQGRLVCYAGKNCAEQLRKVHNVSLRVTAREKIDDVYVVTVEASMPNGRVDCATGAVPLNGLKGDSLANAFMKCETKAKRRATLSICSLGMLDETEVESIPQTQKGNAPTVLAQQPEEGDGLIDDAYRIPFGKYAKRGLEEIDLGDLRDYVNYIERKAEKDGKPLTGQVLDFVERACAHIAAFENGASG